MDEPVQWIERGPTTSYYQGVSPPTTTFYNSVGPWIFRGKRRWNLHEGARDSTGFRSPTPFNAFWMISTALPYDYIESNWLGALWRRWGPRENIPNWLSDWCIHHHHGNGVNIRRFPAIPQDVWDRSRTECLAKATRRKWNIAQSFVEMGKSVETVATRFQKLVRALLLIKKGRFAQAAREFGVKTHKDRSGLWLEYQYGWRPLISDLQNAVDAYNQGTLTNKKPVFHCTRMIQYPVPKPPIGRPVFSVTGGGTISVFTRMDWVVSDSHWDQLKQIGYSDPLTIGWELLPFSFVVDWLVPVGTFLEALQAHVGLTYKGGSSTGRVAYKYRVQLSVVNDYVSGTRPTTLLDNGAIERRPITSTMPAIYVKWPLSSANRAANAVALFAQLRK